MGIGKQEFYEGAALHKLARHGGIRSLRYETPLFVMNNRLLVNLKYSTKGRSPWGFTFMPREVRLMRKKASRTKLIIGLICGSDGVVAFSYKDFLSMATPGNSAIHIACYRPHGKHYEVSGPDGVLACKVSPSNWHRILHN